MEYGYTRNTGKLSGGELSGMFNKSSAPGSITVNAHLSRNDQDIKTNNRSALQRLMGDERYDKIGKAVSDVKKIDTNAMKVDPSKPAPNLQDVKQKQGIASQDVRHAKNFVTSEIKTVQNQIKQELGAEGNDVQAVLSGPSKGDSTYMPILNAGVDAAIGANAAAQVASAALDIKSETKGMSRKQAQDKLREVHTRMASASEQQQVAQTTKPVFEAPEKGKAELNAHNVSFEEFEQIFVNPDTLPEVEAIAAKEEDLKKAGDDLEVAERNQPKIKNDAIKSGDVGTLSKMTGGDEGLAHQIMDNEAPQNEAADEDPYSGYAASYYTEQSGTLLDIKGSMQALDQAQNAFHLFGGAARDIAVILGNEPSPHLYQSQNPSQTVTFNRTV